MQQISENICFGGRQLRFKHESSSTRCSMTFSVFLPPQAQEQACPVLYWLSGLTCTDENFVQKAGAQRIAAELGLIIVAPDTSPRGEGVADDSDGAWDMGLGAGFYLNATQAPWSEHYRMYDYVVSELPALIQQHFPASAQQAISGHSMGGHGALSIAFKNPDKYSSVSAFAPIVAPSQVPWGHKAFSLYLGEEQPLWAEYDSCYLLEKNAAHLRHLPIKVNQGGADNFLAEQLKPELLQAAARKANIDIDYQLNAGYDHSYFFISSFMAEHLQFHARHFA